MTQPDWDDDRLAAAFRARFDRPAPPTLAPMVHRAIAGTSPARFGWLWRGRAWAVASAVVIVVVVGTAAIGLGGFGRLGGGPSGPSDSGSVASASAGTTPGAGATPTEQAVPGSVDGLEIVHVTDAIVVRDAFAQNTELAVQGWFTPAPPLSCGPAPTTEPTSPLQRRCPTQFTWLTEDADSLVHVTANTLTVDAPKGPALNPDLNGLDTSWAPALPQVGTDGGSTPIDVVFVGHFGDRRAALCPAAEVSACQKRFVVDSVAFVRGRPVARSLVRLTDTTPVSSVADIDAVIADEAPQSPILSMAVVDGPIGLAEIEPTLANGQAGLSQRPILWVARVLEAPFISTYIVVDGTDAIYEMNPNNEAVFVGGVAAPSGTPASPGPWPPAGATVVTLTSPVGAGEPPVQVAVVDDSARLAGVAEKGSLDPSSPTVSISDPGAYAEPGKPGRVHLAWTGSICDSRITLTIAADLKSITFDMGPQPNCDSLGVVRQVVLDFLGPVDVSAIEIKQTAPVVPALSVQGPTVTITPSTDLKDGQTVEVRVTGFGVGGKVFLSECASAVAASSLGCGAELAAQPFLVTDDSRSGSAMLVLRASAQAGSAGPATPCTDRCVLVATIDGGYPYLVSPLAFGAGN